MGRPFHPVAVARTFALRLIHLAASPAAWACVAAFAVTALAKLHAVRLLWRRPTGAFAWTIAEDAAVYLGLAALFGLLERRVPRTRPFTAVMGLGLFLLAVANGVYIVAAGDQGSLAALAALWDRSRDVADILRDGLAPWVLPSVAVAAVAALAAHLYARRRTRDAAAPAYPHATTIALAALAASVVFFSPRPRDPAVRRFGRNLLVALGRGLAAPEIGAGFQGYAAPKASNTAAATAEADLPNVVLVILESTRYDHTSLAGADAKAKTPTLAELAADGFEVPVMRAVVPHTTKALWTMLCGQLPLLQRELWELSGDVEAVCLPRMLRDLGYHTAFFQSAQGLFEQRARLVHKLGYDHFQPWEDIRGFRLGYLASDDMSMLRPLEAWLDRTRGDGRPVFVTLLTSSTHHPYKLPPWIQRRVEEEGLPHDTDAERYARLVEGEDTFLAAVLDVLSFRSMRDRTVVIVVGDHGEGFGEHGVMQHDQNIYEEGVRVPFVVAGPGIERRVARGNASALDFLPTVVGLLDLAGLPPPSAFPGLDLSTHDVPDDRPSYLSCWFTERCRGFVVGHHKLMDEREAGERFVFDLAADPDERNPLPVPEALAPHVEAMERVFREHRIEHREMVHPEFRGYGLWWCPEGDDKCKHPRARHPDFRYPLDRETVRRNPPKELRDAKARRRP
ncbi:MAG: hypothetical protein D6705_05585 [Deltaproteobacteria bacterium]|nr:MAG: hypothetical protein D6705_05585 [Deltaproteobacteria bacterium]